MTTYLDQDVQDFIKNQRELGMRPIPIIKELRQRFGFDLVAAKRAVDYGLSAEELDAQLKLREAVWQAVLAEADGPPVERTLYEVNIEALARVSLKTTVLASDATDARNRAEQLVQIYAQNDVTPEVWTVMREPAKVMLTEVRNTGRGVALAEVRVTHDDGPEPESDDPGGAPSAGAC